MPQNCTLYYITDRTAFRGDEATRRRQLLNKIAEATRHAVNYIQLREKDLSTRELQALAGDAMRIILKLRTENPELKTSLLINSRTDVALVTGAAGLHLRSKDLSPKEVRTAWRGGTHGAHVPSGAVSPTDAVIAVSCHSPEEVAHAAVARATFAVLAPIFEKKDASRSSTVGLAALRQACHAGIPVLALGGVTLQNAQSCRDAGAAGIAAIRLFQENELAGIVKQLRG